MSGSPDSPADTAPVTVPELPIPSRAQAAVLRNLHDGNPADHGLEGRARGGHTKVCASLGLKKWAMLVDGPKGAILEITAAGEVALARFEAQEKRAGAGT